MEDNIEKLKANLRKELDELTRVEMRVREARNLLANALCPYKVGDTLINKKGKKAKVTKIVGSYGDYKMYGSNVRKDGSDGAVNELYNWDNWKLAE